MKILALIFRLLLAGVFLFAGTIKATSSGSFLMALLPFTFLPETWLAPISLLLPLAEILAGLLLLLPGTRRLGAVAVLGLCALFIGVLTWALANDLIVACSCFGQDEEPSRSAMLFALLRDGALAAMALFVLQAHTPRGQSPIF